MHEGRKIIRGTQILNDKQNKKQKPKNEKLAKQKEIERESREREEKIVKKKKNAGR